MNAIFLNDAIFLKILVSSDRKSKETSNPWARAVCEMIDNP